MPGNDGLMAFASTEAIQLSLPLIDCLAARLLLTFGRIRELQLLSGVLVAGRCRGA
jgi:hypothetical protein